MHKVIVSTQMMLADRARFELALRKRGCVATFLGSDQALSEDELLELAPDYDGWIAGDDAITRSVLSRLVPKLRVISKWGSGIDSIDLKAASELGVAVYNSPGAFAEPVGEMALGYTLALTRGIVTTHMAVLTGGWPKVQTQTLGELHVGVVGLGAIGLSVATKLRALGSSVSYSDPNVSNPDFPRQSLNDLVAKSDVTIITCDLNEKTFHLIDSALIHSFKSGAFLVNVSRGPIIEEAALLMGLSSGRFGGVALDVFETEPLPRCSDLLAYDNVILGSHNANNTQAVVEAVHARTIENLVKSL